MAGIFDSAFGAFGQGQPGNGVLPPWLLALHNSGMPNAFSAFGQPTGQFPPQYPTGSPVAQNAPAMPQGDAQAVQQPPAQAQPPAAPPGAPATTPAAQGGGFMQGLGNFINANPLTLMALGGGIAKHGMAGFGDAAPVALHEQLQKQKLAELAYQHGTDLRDYQLREKTALENIRHQRATEGQAATAPVKIGTDTWGSDIYAVRDPNAPSGYRRVELSGGTAGGGASPEAATSAGVTGQDYLNTLPAERRPFIEKVANYEIDPRTLSIKGGHRERTLAEVAAFRPDYNQQNYAAAQEGLKKFQSGQQGNSIRSFNTAIEHLDQLSELGVALKNGDIQAVNSISNWWKTQTGQAAPTNFEGLKGIVGQEVVKAIVANGGGEREREEAGRRLSTASSPEQLAQIVATYKGAMAAQLKSLKLQYEQSTLRKDFHRLLSEKAKGELAKHEGSASAGAATTSGAPSAADPLGIR